MTHNNAKHCGRRCLAGAIAFAALALFGAPGCRGYADEPAAQSIQLSPLEIDTKDGKKLFHVEVAVTPAAQRQGLMYRKRLAPDAGMLFVFSRDEPRAFWMKNTYIPLDMIFIASDGTIVAIQRDTTPLSERPIAPAVSAAAVLEINAGTAQALGLAVGDVVHHPAIANPGQGSR